MNGLFILSVIFLLSLTEPWSWQNPPPLETDSHLVILSADGRERRVIFSSPELFESPNWTHDGKSIILNSRGLLWSVPVSGGEARRIDTGTLDRLNNDHGISPDGKWLAISAGPIYILPLEGGTPRQVTPLQPSYWHGWSPDGKRLAYCARREENFDVYDISTDGGEERRLTVSPAYDDGPDYTPDGRWIYFCSDRSGTWDIWRMPPDGAGENDKLAERITSDNFEDWFPHPSPGGEWIVFLSYDPGTPGHPRNQNVRLRILDKNGSTRELVRFFGGQGSINTPSWSPDGKYFAYVEYSPRKPGN